jgi:hypothetical protein
MQHMAGCIIQRMMPDSHLQHTFVPSMEAGKRAAGDALLPARGNSKRVRSGGNEEKTRPLNGGRECRQDGRGEEKRAVEVARSEERQSDSVVHKEKATVDPEEELMRALEEDIRAEGIEVERVGAAALATEEDDDYDESDDEEEERSASRR